MNSKNKSRGKSIVTVVAALLAGLAVLSLGVSLFGSLGGGGGGGASHGNGTIITPGEQNLPFVASVSYPMTELVKDENIATKTTTGFIKTGDIVTDTFYFPNTGNVHSVDVVVNVNVPGIYKISGTVAQSTTAEVKYITCKNTTRDNEWKNIVGKGRVLDAVMKSDCIVPAESANTTLCYQYLYAGRNNLTFSVQSGSDCSALGVSSLTFDLCGKNIENYKNATEIFYLDEGNDRSRIASYTGFIYSNNPEGITLSVKGDEKVSATYKEKLRIEEGGAYRLNILFSQTSSAFSAADLEKVKLIFTHENTGEVMTKTLLDVMNVNVPADLASPMPDAFHIGCSLSCVYVDLGVLNLLQGDYTVTYENPLSKEGVAWNALSMMELVKQN